MTIKDAYEAMRGQGLSFYSIQLDFSDYDGDVSTRFSVFARVKTAGEMYGACGRTDLGAAVNEVLSKVRSERSVEKADVESSIAQSDELITQLT